MVDGLAAEHDRLEKRIDTAIGLASQYGSEDGAHHKQWVITEMVKALFDDDTAYQQWKGFLLDVDIEWDEGIAP